MVCLGQIVYHASVWSIQLDAQKSIAVAKTKIELDSHAGMYVVGDHCLIIHDHYRPVNIFGQL